MTSPTEFVQIAARAGVKPVQGEGSIDPFLLPLALALQQAEQRWGEKDGRKFLVFRSKADSNFIHFPDDGTAYAFFGTTPIESLAPHIQLAARILNREPGMTLGLEHVEWLAHTYDQQMVAFGGAAPLPIQPSPLAREWMAWDAAHSTHW